jgi:ribonuclease BN (tRNA processing enzyme)
VQSLQDRIGAYLSPPLFPVSLAEIPSQLTFHDAPDQPWQIGSATVLAVTVAHQGPTLGYRIEEGGRSLAYIPDHEPSLGVDMRSMGPDWLSGREVAHEADVLIHDAQYSEEEYPDHVGWGHSSIEHVVTFAQMSDVKRLLLFHHDPHHSDDELDALCARARQLWPGSDDVLHLGAEGMEIDLSSAQPFLTRR